MVFGFRVTYYGNGVAGHDPSPMCPCSSCWNSPPAAPQCPCSACWNAPAGFNPHAAPQCPCEACWNAPVGVNPHARQHKQQQQQQQQQQQPPLASSAASIASSTSSSTSSSSSSSHKVKNPFHLGRLLKHNRSSESIRSDMVPLRNATTLESAAETASIMSRP